VPNIRLSKPVYEALPYYYVAIGAIAFAARLYMTWWYWPVICITIGVIGVVGGAVVWLVRRSHRRAA